MINCNIFFALRCNSPKVRYPFSYADDKSPIRERIEEIKSNDKYLHDVVMAGAERARASANETIRAVREIMGIKQF